MYGGTNSDHDHRIMIGVVSAECKVQSVEYSFKFEV